MSRRRPPPTRCPPARFLTPLLLLLFRLQGDAGDNFYLIRSGEVKCTKVGSADEVSRRLKKGDFFGELALLSTDKRAATVSSVEKTTVHSRDYSNLRATSDCPRPIHLPHHHRASLCRCSRSAASSSRGSSAR